MIVIRLHLPLTALKAPCQVLSGFVPRIPTSSSHAFQQVDIEIQKTSTFYYACKAFIEINSDRYFRGKISLLYKLETSEFTAG
jgi:hypothetical protein